jgi:hypothetical protein
MGLFTREDDKIEILNTLYRISWAILAMGLGF